MDRLFKNLLQEYCHENDLPMPNYQTVCLGGTAHSPIFESSVIFKDKWYKSDHRSSKKDAELNVAEKILLAIKSFYSINEKTIVYIDGDNMIYFVKNLLTDNNFDPKMCKFLIFVSYNHHMEDRYISEYPKYENIEMVAIDSPVNNMNFWMAYRIGKDDFRGRIVLVTRDSFGEVVKRIMEKEKIPFFLVDTYEHMKTILLS